LFENLTQREKTLATAVLALVPLCIGFMLLFWFIGKRSANQTSIDSLRSQVREEERKLMTALQANQRRVYYRSVSLPSNFDDARNEYQQWLKQLVRNDVGMSYRSITPRSPAKIKHNGKLIGQTETFTLLATADLPKLVDFLTAFYKVDLLHRINSIKLIPKSAGKAGASARIRTGQLALSIEIEVLSLIDADLERDFVTHFRSLELPEDAYRDAIVKRNIFGPANNTPTVSVSKSSSYTSGKEVRIAISGKDPDREQQLTFELVGDAPIEGAKLLEKKKPDDRRVFLSIPGQPAGEYAFKVRVADDGFPSKSGEKEFKIRFKDKVVRKPPPPKPPKPPKPKFKHAKETRITAIVKDNTGKWQVWVKVRTTGDKYRLAVGETFELDDQRWEVTAIEPGQATFRVACEERTFKRNLAFSL
jgi:hypothetical protein